MTSGWGCVLCGELMPPGATNWMASHREVCARKGGPIDSGQESIVRVAAQAHCIWCGSRELGPGGLPEHRRTCPREDARIAAQIVKAEAAERGARRRPQLSEASRRLLTTELPPGLTTVPVEQSQPWLRAFQELIAVHDALVTREPAESTELLRTEAEQKALEGLHRWLHSPAGDCMLIEAAQDYHTQVGGDAGDAPICQQLELEERDATNEIFDVNEMGISPLVQAAIRALQKTGRYGATVGETMAHVMRAGLMVVGERESGGGNY